jgi:hypothetical protein
MNHRQLNAEVWPLVHKEKLVEAARLVNDACNLGIVIESGADNRALVVLNNWLHYLLNTDMREAARLLWTPTQFSMRPESSQQIWKLFDESTMGLLMGAASMSKSFTMGVRLFLEWLRDPQWTSVSLVGPNEEHLERNLFSHIVNLHKNAKLPLPGAIGERWIGFDRKEQTGAIQGVIIPVGRVKKAGRLQGGKRKPRPEAHPIFGSLSRMFVFIDEIENVPAGIWHDIDNILSNVDEDGAGGASAGFKLFGAYNPTNRGDEVAVRAEPPNGWETFDIEKDYRWKSKRGWDVLRLDGEKSENVIAGKIVIPGIQTRAGLEIIARNRGGKASAGYYTMGRGAYPPQGIVLAIIPPGLLARMRGEFIWVDTPRAVGGADLSLEGAAGCVFTHGLLGLASGVKFMPSLLFPQGNTVMFKNSLGKQEPRMGLLAVQQFCLPKGDTMAMATGLIDLCKKTGVRPNLFCCDRTGVGSGVADMMKTLWSAAIIDINYSESATQTKVMTEDSKTCYEQYDRICSELWFAFRLWGEFGYLMLAPGFDLTNVSQQVTQRLYRSQNGKSKVESKKDYKARGFPSPDEADSLTVFVHAGRIGGGVTPSMQGGAALSDPADDEWWGSYNGNARIDPSNRSDTLPEEQPIL